MALSPSPRANAHLYNSSPNYDSSSTRNGQARGSWYKDPATFTPRMDIFSTQSLGVRASCCQPIRGECLDPQLLSINQTLVAGYPTAPGYLWATLAAHNATAPLGINNGSGSGNQSAASRPEVVRNSKTTLVLALLLLASSYSRACRVPRVVRYAITGCIVKLIVEIYST
jgi:hypothetical protein